jgi:hypothetical protein
VIARLEGATDKRTPSIPILARIAAACGAHFEFGFSIRRLTEPALEVAWVSVTIEISSNEACAHQTAKQGSLAHDVAAS